RALPSATSMRGRGFGWPKKHSAKATASKGLHPKHRRKCRVMRGCPDDAIDDGEGADGSGAGDGGERASVRGRREDSASQAQPAHAGAAVESRRRGSSEQASVREGEVAVL